MAIGLVQSNNASSGAAGPTTITPTLGLASTAGNLLVISVVVAGSSTSITTPGGWTQAVQGAVNAGAHRAALYFLPNNAGGITAVAITITATGGGASASIFEFSGMGTSQAQETTNQSGVGSNTNVPNCFPGGSPPIPTASGELVFLAIGYQPATLTVGNSGDLNTNVASGLSSSGAPNVQLANFWASTGTAPESSGGTMSIAVPIIAAFVRIISSSSSPLSYDKVSGFGGITPIGQFFGGALIGG